MTNPEKTGRDFGQQLRTALFASCVGAGLFAVGAPAYAQDNAAAPQEAAADEAAPAEAIVITGSRIVRRDYQANSPIQTVGSELLQNSTSAALETNLNKLPQFSATAKVPTAGGDIQPTATNTPGAATISLRGIGANRNLVLIDGRRATPANASMAVDINTIPTAAIERVEIISGGASSTYGADAVAGVTNFIMKKNFQGLSLDAQIGTSEHADNTEWTISGLMGTNFADGRGNISLAFSTNTRKAAYQRDRRWYRDLWANPNIGGTGFFPPLAGVNLGFSNLPSAAVINGIFNQAATPLGNSNYTIYANPNGTVFSGFDAVSTAGAYRNKVVDGYNYKALANGQIARNFTDSYLVLPLERYNMYARGNYAINDWLSVFADGTFSKVSTTTVQEPGPITSGWSVNVANDGRALPAELKQILDSRSNPTGTFALRAMLPFNRGSVTDVFTYNMTAGLDGKVPGTDWTWTVFAQQGESETNVLQTGFVSLQRLRAVMQAPNWGAGFKATGNSGLPDNGFGGATATCTSGINPFSYLYGGSVSQDCLDAVSANLKTRAVMQQSIWEFDAQGSLFKLPAGTVSAAIGASYRHDNYHFDNDTYTTQGTMFNDQILGLYPSGNSKGRITAREVYGELLVPVLADLPGVKKLELELGGRISDYNTTGTSYTYKALASWDVTNWLRLRGGYNRAERAPNIAELFLAAQQTFTSAPGGDVCSLQNRQAWSANPTAKGNTATNAANVQALCRTLMQRSGNPTADQEYYSGIQSPNAAFVFPTLTGNANLKPETADTWTLGAVISSPFDSPWLRSLRVAVDWYSIKVKDAIGAQSPDIVQRQCFDTLFNPTLNPNSTACLAVARNSTGALGNLALTYLNSGRFQTQGLDFQVDWAKDIGPGRFTVNSVLNYLISLKSVELPGLSLVDYAGTTGPAQNGLDGGAFRWKLFTTFGYSVGPVNVGLQWRHLPGVRTEIAATVPGTTTVGAGAYDLFNLNASAKVTRDVSFRLGVDNLFNKAPPLFGVDTAPTAGNLAGGSYNAAYYDVNGRRFYVGINAKF
ncbi:MAG: TonB-dependent receptor [Sphingobium sp.]|nr:TonB-dependent receptor [Sphingobium sp.]